ncbi:MAG: acetate/propionate family kinase [Polyangiaceae bacterium]|nr:acetate/propionate family kinase [Polyangiaceae bacterium]
MGILTLRPGLRALRYAYFDRANEPPRASGTVVRPPAPDKLGDAAGALVDQAVRACRQEEPDNGPTLVAIRVAHGGPGFDRPVPVESGVLHELETLTPHAPLHLPAAIRMAEAAKRRIPDADCFFVFDTAFFCALPHRERLYGLDRETRREIGFERMGRHGLFHAAASDVATRELRCSGSPGPCRTLSICLEPRPELAAVLGDRPIMVTGGLTPLEGLPGETTCGDLDPGVVLRMAFALNMGPEQIDRVLTRESGLSGLTGRRVNLDEVLAGTAEDVRAARRLFEYRLLLASGAGTAALCGIDAIALSGRYAGVGIPTVHWLIPRLMRGLQANGRPIAVHVVDETLDQIMALTALRARATVNTAPRPAPSL